jgi:hypothetical protein
MILPGRESIIISWRSDGTDYLEPIMSERARRPLPKYLTLALLSIACGTMVVLIVFSASPIIATIHMLYYVPMIGGIMLIARSARRPTKDAIAPQEGRSHGKVSAVSQTGHAGPGDDPIRDGHRLPFNPWMLALGLAFLLMTRFLFLERPYLVNRFVPTRTLIAAVTSPDAASDWSVESTPNIWSWLQNRNLSEGQAANLARRCVMLLEAGDDSSSTSDWVRVDIVEHLIRAGQVPREIIDRFYNHQLAVQLNIVVPKTIQIGQELRLDVEVETPRQSWISERMEWALVEGFYIGDSSDAAARLDQVIGASRLSKCSWLRSEAGRRANCSKATLVAERPGPLTVRFAVWIAISHEWIEQQPITWHPNGVPEVPAGVVWIKRFESESTITVEDESE